MKEEEAREMAFAIIGGDFEELLAEHDIVLPSADREGREEEACIYGIDFGVVWEEAENGTHELGRVQTSG